MLKRTLVFSSAVSLSLKDCQLVVVYKDVPDVSVTDKQYSGIVNIWGAIEKKSKPAPMQLEFF